MPYIPWDLKPQGCFFERLNRQPECGFSTASLDVKIAQICPDKRGFYRKEVANRAISGAGC
jgi:hypothetical protein